MERRRGHDHNLGSLSEMPPESYPGGERLPPQVPYPAQTPEAEGFGPTQVRLLTSYSDSVQLVTSAASIPVLRANPNRKQLIIQNNGTGVVATSAAIRVGFGKAATLNSMRIVFDGYWEPFVVPTDAIWLLAESATAQQVIVIEG